jgi:flagellar capping protein FliD
MLNTVVAGAGRYRILADVGLKLGDGAKLEFDEDKFRTAYATDPDAVQKLFSAQGSALGDDTPLSKLNSGRGVRTSGTGKPDFRIALRDGTNVDVSLGDSTKLSDVITAINTAAGTKLKAELRDDGTGLRLTDLTGATANPLKVTALGGSQAAFDLRLTTGAVNNVLDGGKIVTSTTISAGSKGIGGNIVDAITKLVDPVSGIITRENQTLDARTQQFQNRMDQIDQLITQKRTRLETQFANMESVLAKMQSQQSALGQIGSVKSA